MGVYREVWVRLSVIYRQTIFPPARFRFTDQTLDLSGEAPGVLHGWYRASTGEWYGLVSFTILYAGATRTPGLQLDNQLVPAEALRPRKYGAERRR